jgi:hypothetical protein
VGGKVFMPIQGEYECIKINRKTKDNEKDNIQQGKESD